MSYDSLRREREDLGMQWGPYLLYVLEVNETDVNRDGLKEVATALEESDE